MRRKARQKGLLMAFLILIHKLCARVGVSYFPSDVASSTIGVIDLDKKHDEEALRIKKTILQALRFLESTPSLELDHAPEDDLCSQVIGTWLRFEGNTPKDTSNYLHPRPK